MSMLHGTHIFIMKIAVCFLFVAVCCYFSPAAGHCMRSCHANCYQGNVNDMNCLKNALKNNFPATLKALADLLCSYDRCKNLKDKTEIITAIRNLKAVTQCPLEYVLGHVTMEEFNRDISTIDYLMKTAVDVMKVLDLGIYSTTLCGPLKDLTTKISDVFNLLSIGDMHHTTETNGGLEILKQPAIQKPSQLQPALGAGAVDGVTVINDRLAGGALGNNGVLPKVLSTVNDVAVLVAPVDKTLTKPIESLTNTDLGNTLNSLTNSAPSVGGVATGVLGSLVGGLGGATGGVGANAAPIAGGIGGGTDAGDKRKPIYGEPNTNVVGSVLNTGMASRGIPGYNGKTGSLSGGASINSLLLKK